MVQGGKLAGQIGAASCLSPFAVTLNEEAHMRMSHMQKGYHFIPGVLSFDGHGVSWASEGEQQSKSSSREMHYEVWPLHHDLQP